MDVIAITPTLISLGNLNQEDIVLLDMDGNILTEGKPSSESEMHLKIYKARDDVNAIIHTHSPYATGFSFSPKKIKRLEGFGAIQTPFLNEIEYKKPGTTELADEAAKGLGKEDVLILKQHGVICVADNIAEAESLSKFVEEIAKTQFIAHMLTLNEE